MRCKGHVVSHAGRGRGEAVRLVRARRRLLVAEAPPLHGDMPEPNPGHGVRRGRGRNGGRGRTQAGGGAEGLGPRSPGGVPTASGAPQATVSEWDERVRQLQGLLRLLLPVSVGGTTSRRAPREFISVPTISLERGARQPDGHLALHIQQVMILLNAILGGLADSRHCLCHYVSSTVPRPVAGVDPGSSGRVSCPMRVDMPEADEVVSPIAPNVIQAPPHDPPKFGINVVGSEAPGAPLRNGVDRDLAVGDDLHGPAPQSEDARDGVEFAHGAVDVLKWDVSADGDGGAHVSVRLNMPRLVVRYLRLLRYLKTLPAHGIEGPLMSMPDDGDGSGRSNPLLTAVANLDRSPATSGGVRDLDISS